MNFASHFRCNVFPLAKQIRLAYNISTSSSTINSQIIHVDIYGPFFLPSTNGTR